MLETIREFANWWMNALGFVAVREAVAYAELDRTLTALGVTGEERDRVLEMAARIAQAGFTTTDLETALNHIARYDYTGGHLPDE